MVIMCGSRGGDRGSGLALKNHKNIGFSSDTGPDPLKDCSYQASIQCWVIISMPAKRHLMTFRWRPDDSPLMVVLGSSLPSSTKKKVVKVGPPLTKLSGSVHGYETLFLPQVQDIFLPPDNEIHYPYRYGYTVHNGQQGLFKLDLEEKKYLKAVDFTMFECVPKAMAFLPSGETVPPIICSRGQSQIALLFQK